MKGWPEPARAELGVSEVNWIPIGNVVDGPQVGREPETKHADTIALPGVATRAAGITTSNCVAVPPELIGRKTGLLLIPGSVQLKRFTAPNAVPDTVRVN